MTGNAWLCLTTGDFNSIVPSEVLAYYEAPSQTWGAFSIGEQVEEEFIQGLLSKRFKLPRGPYTIEGIECWFVNLDVDYTHEMSTAILGLSTTRPFGFILNERQIREYTVPQWYIGTLAQVVAYNNLVTTSEGYTGGTNKWADPINNHSNNDEWAIPKHPSYTSNMTLIQTSLPDGWFDNQEI